MNSLTTLGHYVLLTARVERLLFAIHSGIERSVQKKTPTKIRTHATMPVWNAQSASTPSDGWRPPRIRYGSLAR